MKTVQQIEIKSQAEIELMRRAGALLREVRERIGEKVRPGITTRELDLMARQMIDARAATPAFLGYRGFPGTLCTSINEQVVHGIPSRRKVKDGEKAAA